MKTLQFKTNINCAGCVAKVTPFLNEENQIEKWTVDTNHPSKILTIDTNRLTAAEIEEKVKKAGFKIEPIKQ